MKMKRNERGQTTTMLALVMGSVMVATMAFAIDIGYMFHEKRMAQAAADAAALAAMEEVVAGNAIDSTLTTNAANVAATNNGFNTSAAVNPAVVTLSTSGSGIYSSAGGSVPNTWI